MFAVIEFTAAKRRFLGRNKIESERIALPGGEVFFIVKAEARRGRAPWKKLSQCLGFLREAVILPKGAAVPEGIDIKAFEPEKFPYAVLCNSAVKQIKKEKKTGDRLCVVDEKGLFIPLAEELILNFGEVKVITPLVSDYEQLSRSLMEKYGAALLITDTGKADGDVVILPDGECVPVTFSGELYCLKPRRLLSGRVLCPKGIALPPIFEKFCPEGVDKFLFAAALYEKCSIGELGEVECEGFS